jgi:hypothetical protein
MSFFVTTLGAIYVVRIKLFQNQTPHIPTTQE